MKTSNEAKVITEASPKLAVPDTASSKEAVADSANAKSGDDRSTKQKTYFVTQDGRSTGALRKQNETVEMTPDQAKFLILGGHLSETKVTVTKTKKAAE